MSDTPETDAELHAIKAVCKDEYMLDQMAEFSRKLERERDEAIRQRNETNESSKYAVDYAIRERDEAREIAGRLAHFLERPAYSVDEAIARMEALNSYKKQKSQ
jgi:hypothetical protein